MRYSLRALVLVTAAVPAVVGYAVMSIRTDADGHVVFKGQDTILTLAILSWISIWAYFVYGRDAQPKPYEVDCLPCDTERAGQLLTVTRTWITATIFALLVILTLIGLLMPAVQ